VATILKIERVIVPGRGSGRAFFFKEPVRKKISWEEFQRRRSQLISECLKQGGEAYEYLASLIEGDEEFNELLYKEYLSTGDVIEALKRATYNTVKKLSEFTDPFIKVRINDLAFATKFLIDWLSGWQKVDEEVVVIAPEVGIDLIARFDLSKVKGVCVERANEHSHLALILRSYGIPYFVVSDVSELEGKEYLGFDTEKMVVEIGKRRYTRDFKEMCSGRLSENCIMRVNINSQVDVDKAQKVGFKKIGLVRTEFLYLKGKWSVEEQLEFYESLLVEFDDVILRLADVGGDKVLAGDGSSPYFRGVRRWLKDERLRVNQLLAFRELQRRGYDNFKILVPFVSEAWEVAEVRSVIRRYNVSCEVGVLVEVPALVVDLSWLEFADFVSVGTNDLTTLLFAADRRDPEGELYFNDKNPAVVMAIKRIVNAAKRSGKEVGVCGQLASDPEGAVLCLVTGVDYISVELSAAERVCSFLSKVPKRIIEGWASKPLSYRIIERIKSEIKRWREEYEVS